MTRRLFLFDRPDRFITGTIGEPGQRVFYLQARDGVRTVSVSLEKVQVAALAERLRALLDELERRELIDATGAGEDAEPLDEPLNEAFRAGTLSIGWDAQTRMIVIEARDGAFDEQDEEPDEYEDDDPDGPDLIRVRMEAGLARAFADRAERVVAAGRLPCPLCGEPLDPQGHICPRRNGRYLH
jgi:uncharacterized repeat protein (TIGR03847 family)